MWLIRTNKIKPKDYNYIKRVFDKIGFFPRKIPKIIFIKALFFYILQKKSWRKIGEILNCNHLALFSFYSNYKNNEELKNILHYFCERRITLFIENKKSFSSHELDNNEKFLELTKIEIENILENIL